MPATGTICPTAGGGGALSLRPAARRRTGCVLDRRAWAKLRSVGDLAEHDVFKDKPALVIGASTGLFGAVWAQAEVRKVLDHIGADVIDTELPVGHAHEAVGEAELAERTAAVELERQLAMLVALARDLVAEPAAA